MTWESVGQMIVPRLMTNNGSASTSFFNQLIDADGEGSAVVLDATSSETITAIGFRCNAISVSGQLEVSIQTVDANNLPSGTLWATNTNATVTPTANTAQEVTLTSSASVAAGDRYAVVVRRVSGTFAGNLSQVQTNAAFPYLGVPSFAARTSASWAHQTSAQINIWPVFASGYGVLPNIRGLSGLNSVSFSTSTTPDVVGNVIRFPYAVRVDAIWALADVDGSITYKILDADGSTILASVVNAANYPNDTGVSYNVLAIPTLELSANVDYRVVADPTTTTSSSVTEIQFFNDDLRAAYPCGEFAWKTTAKDPTGAGSYTDQTDRFLPIGVVVTQIDIPSGGGGTTASGVIGIQSIGTGVIA